MTKEETLLSKHLEDLAQSAWQMGIAVYSNFLNLNEQNIYHSLSNSLSYIHSELFGGYDFAERRMAGFFPDDFRMDRYNFPLYGEDADDGKGETDENNYRALFPIRAVRIQPLNSKFAEEMSHRDYLGSLMNLGIDRSTTGDILVSEDGAIVFCEEKMANYICENLTRVRHTSVICRPQESSMIRYQPETENIRGTVASVRLDSLMALAFRESRSSLTRMIADGKVFINGRLTTTNACRVKQGDIISVRGLGRFRYAEEGKETRKGRLFVRLEKYI